MKAQILLVTITLALHCSMIYSAASSEEVPESRVSGGADAVEGEFPWQVSLLGEGDDYYCAGVIISEDYVLTSATCIYWDIITTVGVGSVNLSDPLHKYHTSFLFVHPDFNATSPSSVHEHNLAILRVDPSFQLSELVAAVKLPDADTETSAGTQATVTGWGSVEWSGEASDILQKADVVVTSREICKQSFEALSNSTGGFLCTEPGANNENACQNDAGGSLTVDGELRGMVSHGEGCVQLLQLPSLHLDIPYYRSWIYNITGV